MINCLTTYLTRKEFYVVLEYLEGGELFDRIVKKSYYNEKEARDLVFLLLQTIKYLHDQDIVHRWGRGRGRGKGMGRGRVSGRVRVRVGFLSCLSAFLKDIA